MRASTSEGSPVARRDHAHAAGPDVFPRFPVRAPAPSRRSSARWIRTLTDPSDFPRTPAISAVLSSSTNRRTIAWRRSPGSRPTARHAARAWSRRTASSSTLRGSATMVSPIGSTDGGRASPALAGDLVPGDLEEPDPEGRCALAVGRARALLEPLEVGQGRDECRLGGVLRGVMVAELVVGVGVHAGQVPAIQGVEAGRLRFAASTSGRSRSRWASRGTASFAAPDLHNARRAISLHPAYRVRRRRRWPISPASTAPLGRRRRGRGLDEERPRCRRRRRPR